MIHLIPIYRTGPGRVRLTFSNGLRSCRRDDPRRHALDCVVLARSDWRRLYDDDRIIVNQISLLEGIGPDGLILAARRRAWGLRLAPARIVARLEGHATLRAARRTRETIRP